MLYPKLRGAVWLSHSGCRQSEAWWNYSARHFRVLQRVKALGFNPGVMGSHQGVLNRAVILLFLIGAPLIQVITGRCTREADLWVKGQRFTCMHTECPMFNCVLCSIILSAVSLHCFLSSSLVSWAIWGNRIRSCCQEMLERNKGRKVLAGPPLHSTNPSSCVTVNPPLRFLDVALYKLAVIFTSPCAVILYTCHFSLYFPLCSSGPPWFQFHRTVF